MKKKIIAVLLSVIMLLGLPMGALAAQFRIPQFGEIVTAVQADLNEQATGLSTIAKLNVSLLRSLTEKAQNIEISEKDLKAVTDKASALLAQVYEKMGSYAANLIAKIGGGNNDGNGGTTPATPSTPSTPSDGGNTETPSTPDKPTEAVTFADLSKELGKYLFIRVENADEVADLIAKSCDFSYTVLNDGHGTVYICVNVEENPQIFNYGVFRHLVEDLYAQQGEELRKNGSGDVDYLMSYEHIAGELALHALIYAASNEFLRVTGVNSSRILNLYKSAAQANLNIDEARVPSELISIIGSVLMNFMWYHLMNAFGLI